MKDAALITGATSGLGTELAKLHAARKGDLVLAGRSQEKLDSTRSMLEEKYNVEVMTICVDLSKIDSAEEVYRQTKEAGVEIEYLINNAGYGGRGEFHKRSMEQDMTMLYVDVIALTKLMKLYLPEFVSRGHGRILNVSSPASLMPGPLQAEYYAAKSYVTSLSNAVWQELKDTGVTVTTLMPGAMDTGFVKASNMEGTKLLSHLVSPAVVAEAGYKGMMKGKLNVFGGLTFSQRLFVSMVPFLPRKMVMKSIYKMQQQN